MKKIGHFLNLKKKEKKTSWDEKSIFYAFNRVIKEEYGNQGAVNLKTSFYKNGKLFISSKSSTWASEIWINRSSIKRKTNEELGSEVIKEIKLKNES